MTTLQTKIQTNLDRIHLALRTEETDDETIRAGIIALSIALQGIENLHPEVHVTQAEIAEVRAYTVFAKVEKRV